MTYWTVSKGTRPRRHYGTMVVISRKLQEFLLCKNAAHLFPLQLTGDKAAGDKAAGDKAAKDMEEEVMAPVEMIKLF